jgi:hypothetical protein
MRKRARKCERSIHEEHWGQAKELEINEIKKTVLEQAAEQTGMQACKTTSNTDEARETAQGE